MSDELTEREAQARRTANEVRSAAGVAPITEEKLDGAKRTSRASGGADQAKPKSGNRSRRSG